ncbi:MAG: 16S rRNA processing protein RimM [Chloroflexi bacterium]|nr:16S rRNA processing protein RimM [Chloroflexota bacterium]
MAAGEDPPPPVPPAKAARRRPAPPPPPQEPPQEPREGFTAVGRIARPHGLRGEVRVAAFTEGAPNLQRGRPVYLDGKRYVVVRARPERDAWILQLNGLTDRDAVEGFRGFLLEAADGDVLRADPESYFVHELIGLDVVTAEGRDLGKVTDVMQTGANDVYVVTGPGGEVLVPAIESVVREIDLLRRRLTITPLPGLLDEPE